MKRMWFGFGLGLLAGVVFTFLVAKYTGLIPGSRYDARKKPVICYSCFWKIYGPKLQADLIDFYFQYRNPDPLIMADVRYILWRASGLPDCDVRTVYESVARSDSDSSRRLKAKSILGFGAEECGAVGATWFKQAAQEASGMGLKVEAQVLDALSSNSFKPVFAETTIESELQVPPQAQSFILGESRIEVTAETRVGAQVDRVARDWISYQIKWDQTGRKLDAPALEYHEGAMVNAFLSHSPGLQIYPLTGAIAVRRNDKWYAPDEAGVFRFELLTDKIQYPTTHAWKDTAYIEDTHGISALVPQAIERKMDVVVGCGDSEGKAKAAYHLAQKGIHVFFPGDRYQDLLLGHKGKGVLMGGAPVRFADGKVIIGSQPVRFLFKEKIVVEDTKEPFPVQYYDASARYFRRLAKSVPLDLIFVEVPAADMIEMVLKRARLEKSSAIAVRVATTTDAYLLRLWLNSSKSNRAILFHSGLYPYAQDLFLDYPLQVTFGDLKPRFE